MKRTIGLLTGLILISVAAIAVSPDSAADLHRRALVIDTHSDTIIRLLDEDFDMGARSDSGHMDLPRLREGGVDAQVFAVWTSPKIGPEAQVPRVLRMIDALHGQLAKYPDQMELAQSAGDIRRISNAGKIAAILGVEGGHAINNDLRILRTYRRLGVLYMTLTWMNNNEWADGSGDSPSEYGEYYGNIPDHGGLTDFGREVVREMNRIGMIVDISHVSDATFYDVMEVTTKPVIASHSCAWALNPHFRNIKDDMLRALARNGGVIGINFYPKYLSPEGQIADVAVVVDHIDHAVKIAGVDHVGLGSDFDGVGSLPQGLEDCSKMPAITAELVKRGYAETDIIKILGGNFLRVIEVVVGS